MKDKIVAILGKSGAGKDTLAQTLSKLGITSVVSYTDRKKRICETDGVEHYFKDTAYLEDIINKGKAIAHTKYNGSHYYATTFDEVSHKHTFVVNQEGYDMLVKTLGKDNVLCVLIDADEDVREERMIVRGDDIKDVNSRIEADREMFKDLKYDYILKSTNDNFLEILYEVKGIVKEFYRGKFNYNEFDKYGVSKASIEYENKFK